MLALGLLLVAASGVLIAAVVLSNTDSASVSAFGETVDALSLGELFAAGAVTGAALLLGLTMMAGGAGRRRRVRKSRRQQLRDERLEREHLEEENARLRAAVREDAVLDTGDPYPAGTYEAETGERSGRHTIS